MDIQNTVSIKSSRNKKTKKFLSHWEFYLMMLPGFITLAIFAYFPMYGLILSFKEYSPFLGIMDSVWVGFDNFKYAVLSYGFLQLVKNTLALGILKLIFAFPSSIILALLINELKNGAFKKSVQTISYLPYFISWVIVNAIMYLLLGTDYGIINNMLVRFFGEEKAISWYTSPQYWRAILTITTIWKSTGWGTIIFLAGLTAVSPELYEAAYCDGAGRWKQTIHVSLPGMMPVIAMSFILSVSGIVRDDFEQVYALVGNNSLLWPKVNVIGTWMYQGLRGNFRSWGQVTAVGFVQGIISFLLLFGANVLVSKTDNKGLF